MTSQKSSLAVLAVGAIGTSVLHAVKEVFGSGHVPFTSDNVYGVLSIFFWMLTVIVSLKYVTLVLRADNHGEGGLIAMLALATSYFLSRDSVMPTIGSGMARWREKLFAQMHHNASGAAYFLNLPNNSVAELCSKMKI